MNYQDDSYKQVRRPKGGGTREIVVKKEDTVSKVLDIGRKLFIYVDCYAIQLHFVVRIHMP